MEQLNHEENKELSSNLIYKIEIPDYIEFVQLSKKRRPIYYKKGTKIPKKYLNNSKYKYNSLGFLIDENNEKILKNIRAAGTPKFKKIRGNDLWSGIDHNLRSKIANEIKSFLYPYIKPFKKLTKEAYPIGVAMEFRKPIGRGDWDLDNHALFYKKCLLDVLKNTIIEDDSVQYVRSTPCTYIESEETLLTITIFKI
jgi:hypothetical protein